MSKPYDIYKPTKMQVIVPIIILVVTLIAGGIMMLAAKKLGVEHEKISYLAPGTEKMELEQGSYTLYLLTEADYEGKHYTAPETFKGVDFKISFKGSEVALNEPQDAYSFGRGNYQGKILKQFNAAEKGIYEMQTSVTDEKTPEVVVAVGMTDEHVQAVVTLTIVASMVMLMGVLQFAGYLLLNGGKMLYYMYRKNMDV